MPVLIFCHPQFSHSPTFQENLLNRYLQAAARWTALFVLLSIPLFAQSFSADFVSTRTGGVGSAGKLYVSNDKARFESDRQAASGGKPVILLDLTQHLTTMLLPARKMYVTYPQGIGVNVPIWRLNDTSNACTEWEMYAKQMKTESKMKSCKKLGNESLDGRSAVKYEIASTDAAVSHVWVDPKLHTMLKHESPQGTVELKNIKEGSQAANLFTIPDGYEKMSAPGMQAPKPSPK
jgi:hypothetical protein